MSDKGASIVVLSAGPEGNLAARAVADKLDLPLVRNPPAEADTVAVVTDGLRFWLQQGGGRPPGPVAVDFASPEMQYRRKGGQNELLGRAVGRKADRKPTVLDCTAGLGRDAYVLADLGCHVVMTERSAVLAYLLEAAIQEATISGDSKVASAAARLSILAGDCRELSLPLVDVIYLDPMFPEKKKSAATKKDLATLQLLHGEECDEADDMLAWALQQDVKRVVLKRPIKAPETRVKAKAFAIQGKAVRFDVFLPAGASL